MDRARTTLPSLSCIALCLAASAAGAEPSELAGDSGLTMLFVRTPGDDAMIDRLRAELGHGRWRFVDDAAPDAEQRLAARARDRGADAALRFDAGAHAIELWVAARSRQQLDSLELLREPDDALLSLRAAEAIRARGLPVGVVEPAAVPEPRATAAPADEAVQRADREPEEQTATRPAPAPALSLELAPATLWSPGGMGPTLSASASAQARVLGPLAVRALVLLPLWNPALQTEAGTVETAPSVFALGAEAQLRLSGNLWLAAGGDAALVLMHMSGDTDAPFEGRSLTVSTGALLAHTAAHWSLHERLRVSARLLAGATLDRIGARVMTMMPIDGLESAEREVAHFGRPLMALSLGLELGF